MGKKNAFFSIRFPTFVSYRFAMLNIFYKQLMLGDSTESCL